MLSIAGIALTPALATGLGPPLLLKVGPSFHRNLATIEFAFFLVVTTSFTRFSSRLAGVTPREIIEFPECISRKDKVPDWEREQVYKHPGNVRNAVSC